MEPVRTVRPRTWATAAGLALAAALIGLVYLWPVLSGQIRVPGGYDTPKYLWRANLVEHEGFEALTAPDIVALKPLPERAAFPVLASLVHGTTGVAPLQLLYVLPTVVAVVIGLGAAAFARRCLGEPGWAAPVFAVAVAVSLVVARTAIGYTDQLLFQGISVAAAIAAVLVAVGEATPALAVGILLAGFFAHWIFALVFVAILVLASLLATPLWRTDRRAGQRRRELPSMRLAVVAAVALALAVAAYAAFVAIEHPPAPAVAHLSKKILAIKYARYAGNLKLPLLLAAAFAGGAAAWFARRPDRRRSVALVVVYAWAGVGVAGVIAYRWLGLAIPAYRLLLAALGLSFLVAALLTSLPALIERALARTGTASRARRGVAASIGVAAVAAGLVATTWVTYDLWRQRIPSFTEGQAQQASAAGWYLEHHPKGPAIIVVSSPAYAKLDRDVRSMMPPSQITRPRLFIGAVADLLLGVPTPAESRRFTLESERTFRDVKPLLSQDPIIIALSAFGRSFDAPIPGDEIAPGVTVVRGPGTGTRNAPPVDIYPGNARVVADALLVLAMLWLAGLGWSRRLIGPRRLAVASAAPAVGLAALALFGVVLGVAGVPLGGAWAVGIVVLTAALGWVPLPRSG